MAKLDGKVAIVTGAARGLGRAYAKRLAGLGAKVAVADLNLRSYEESSDAGAISAAPMRGRSRRRRPRRASERRRNALRFFVLRIANSIPLPRACSRSASKPAGARCRRRPKQRCLPTLPGQAANSGRRRSPCVDVALALVEDVRGRYPIPVQAVACAAGDVA